jgi:hypothetical protein
MEIPDLTDNPELEELRKVQQQLDTISGHLEADNLATDSLRGVYEQAQARLQEQLAEMASSPTVQDCVADIGQTAIVGYEQLAPLDGIMSAEELTPLREEFDGRVKAALAFFETYGAVTEEAASFIAKVAATGMGVRAHAEVTPVEPEAEPAAPPTRRPARDQLRRSGQPESKADRPKVLVEIEEDAVLIGKEGNNKTKLTATYDPRHSDYSALRAEVLDWLISASAGKEVSPHEIWAGIHAEETVVPPYDYQAMTQALVWMKQKLTYRRSPLVISNGKRGNGSRYHLNPRLDIELVGNYYAADRQGVESKKDTLAEEFGLSDLYITANHLAMFGPLLKDSGIETPSPTSLESYQPNLKRLCGDAKAIAEYRVRALERVELFMDDVDNLTRFLSNYALESPEYEFVNFLHGLSDQQEAFVERLFAATIKNEPALHHGAINGVTVKYYDRFDSEILPLTPAEQLPEQHALTVAIDAELRGSPVEEPAAAMQLTDRSETANDTTGQSDVMAAEGATSVPKPAAVEVRAPKGFSVAERAKLGKLETLARGVATTFVASLSPNRSYARPQLQAKGIGGMTPTRVASAKDAGIVKRVEHLTFSMEDAIRITAYTDPKLQNLYTGRKYKREIDAIVKRAMAEAIKAKNGTSQA